MTCKLTAYRVSDPTGWTLEPAPAKREWMDATPNKFAYRCLPLVMANQAGWVVGCPVNFSLNWNGRTEPAAIALRFPDGQHPANRFIATHFGNGIVTFSLPWLFRTSRGYGIWVHGPANCPKEGMAPLEGVVETDWAPYTFTMNWRVMKRNTEVYFRKGEAVCMLTPCALDLLEHVEPEVKSIDEDEQLKMDFFTFTARRSGNLEQIHAGGDGEWAMDYMKGHFPDGTPVERHRKAFKLRVFPGV